MFIIADQHTVGISGERGFSGARQAEEERNIAVFTHVGRAVHGERVFGAGGQDEIDDRENPLFDFAGVAGTSDEKTAFFYINDGEVVLAGSVCFRIGFESRGTQDRPASVKIAEHVCIRPEKHIAGKLIAPGILSDHPETKAVVGIFAGVGGQIAHIQVFFIEIAADLAP